MYYNHQQCPICHETHFENFISCTDFTVSSEIFSIVRCSQCQFLFTDPRPSNEQLGSYYASEEYISHTNKGNNLINIIYRMARNFTLQSKIKLINSLTQERNLLDYGCGTGDFLAASAKKRWETHGVEPDEKARSYAITENKQHVSQNINDISPDKQFDIITLWHVLEHVSELNGTLKKLIQHLKPKGKLLIAVPNPNAFDAYYYKEHWAAYDVPRHLYHFSTQSMENLLKIHGLTIINKLPMKLDSYYVSLLSEKYKSGKKHHRIAQYFNALRTGYLSNKKAKSTSEYSSLIYIITI